MAETLISPGVFTRENDQTFLPQGVGNIGAAVIGPTLKGPAMTPVSIHSEQEFYQVFGSTNPNYYLPYSAKEYFRAGGNNLTVIRTLFEGGYTLLHPISIVATGSFGKSHITMLHPSQIVSDNVDFYDGTLPLFHQSTLLVNASGSLTFKVSGSYTVDSSTFPSALTPSTAIYTSSIDSTSANYLGKLLGKNPNDTQDPCYLYTLFDGAASSSLAADPNTQFYFESGSFSMLNDYTNASTPWIISQTVSGQNRNLFKFWTISHGNSANYETKIGISNIRPAGTIPGSEYGSFSITVRAVDQSKLIPQGSPYNYADSDTKPMILEQYDNVNLDPNSSRYIGRVIGDKYNTYINGKVVVNGNYSNKSKYVYVEVDSAVMNQVYSPELVPFGFAALVNPLPSNFTSIQPAAFATTQILNGSFNKKKWFGLDYLNMDNLNYLKPLPSTGQTGGTNVKFLLSNCLQHASAVGGYGFVGLTGATALESRKFLVPFQGGFDGIQPNKRKLVGTEIVAGNSQGYDLTDNLSSGYSIYKKAIDILSNPDEIDINLLTMPGTIYSLHSGIIDYAATMCEDRGDVFDIFDCVAITDSPSTAISAVETIDNNYSATYYPWVKIMDTNLNKPVWVPPGVIMPAVIAYNDIVGDAWWAPAGMNRGALTYVLDAYSRLTVPERNELSAGRVNPIATFAKDGVVVWGQNTLQAKPSDLSKINVRRLLIAVKKFIASATRYLVFEQNTTVTRNKFKNICNPYLEMVMAKQGLYYFAVVMDEKTNTPDLIDRQIMAGYIELQCTKTAEIIQIDFNLTPTGATFTQ